jgi:hypothetical protein
MNHIEEFADQRQKSWCIHCGGWISELETNRDHVPSRGLLKKPYPDCLPVVQVCQRCNGSFSFDEEYLIVFLGAVLAGTTDPELQLRQEAATILRRSPKLRERIEGSKKTCRTPGGETKIIWKPEENRVRRVIVKNARGHAFFEVGEPMLSEPEHVWFAPMESLTDDERRRLEDVSFAGGWPEVGSRMMTRLATGEDLSDGWVIVQDGVYRYVVSKSDGMLVKVVLFEYLAAEVYWCD